jgi:hypothetical protein
VSLEVIWDFPALATWDKKLSLSEKHVAGRAIYEYAETGVGNLRWWPPYQRLRAGPRHEVAVRVDREAGELHVIHLYETRA